MERTSLLPVIPWPVPTVSSAHACVLARVYMYAQENERGELGEGEGRRAREKETERWIGAPPNIVRLCRCVRDASQPACWLARAAPGFASLRSGSTNIPVFL